MYLRFVIKCHNIVVEIAIGTNLFDESKFHVPIYFDKIKIMLKLYTRYYLTPFPAKHLNNTIHEYLYWKY